MRIIVYDPKEKTHCEYETWADAGHDVVAVKTGESNFNQDLSVYNRVLDICEAYGATTAIEPIVRDLIAYCSLIVRVKA